MVGMNDSNIPLEPDERKTLLRLRTRLTVRIILLLADTGNKSTFQQLRGFFFIYERTISLMWGVSFDGFK